MILKRTHEAYSLSPVSFDNTVQDLSWQSVAMPNNLMIAYSLAVQRHPLSCVVFLFTHSTITLDFIIMTVAYSSDIGFDSLTPLQPTDRGCEYSYLACNVSSKMLR